MTTCSESLHVAAGRNVSSTYLSSFIAHVLSLKHKAYSVIEARNRKY